jgi:hypothetical protein
MHFTILILVISIILLFVSIILLVVIIILLLVIMILLLVISLLPIDLHLLYAIIRARFKPRPVTRAELEAGAVLGTVFGKGADRDDLNSKVRQWEGLARLPGMSKFASACAAARRSQRRTCCATG